MLPACSYILPHISLPVQMLRLVSYGLKMVMDYSMELILGISIQHCTKT